MSDRSEVQFLDTVLYTNDFITISHAKGSDYLFVEWSGHLDADKARRGCLAVLDCLKETHFTKILNSNLRVTGHYPGAIDWVGKVWFSSLSDLGVKWFAWVYSPEFFTQLSTDYMVNLNSKVTINTFLDLESALVWITNVS